MSTEKLIEIRDQRRRQMFRIDDEYIDKYARICGVNATAVYMSLCRHVNGKQESFPSIQRIGFQHGISKPTIIKAIKELEAHGIITVKRERDPKTKRQMVNIYTLMDVASWVKPVSLNDTGIVESDSNHREIPENPMSSGDNAPSKGYLPGAGSNLEAEPGKNYDEKPGKGGLLEGNTKRREHIEGSVAQSAPASVCQNQTCKGNAMKGVFFCEQHQPMQCFQFVEWYRRSEQRHIKIIAEWADELRLSGRAPELRTVAQWRAWAKPILTAAKDISVFDDDQISVAMKRMMAADYITDFNLHTLKTFLINTKR